MSADAVDGPEGADRGWPAQVEQLLDLAVAAQAQGQEQTAAELREEAVRRAMPAARSAARVYAGRGEDLEDLEQVACLGLVKAVAGYRPGEGRTFLAYAMPTLHGELKRWFRDHSWDVRPPRRLQELHLSARTAVPELTQALGRSPTRGELAEWLSVPEEELRLAEQAAEAYSLASLDAVRDSGSVVCPDERVELLGEHLTAWSSALRSLDDLPERDQWMIAMSFFGGRTQQSIAEDLHISQVQVSRAMARTMRLLRERLDDSA